MKEATPKQIQEMRNSLEKTELKWDVFCLFPGEVYEDLLCAKHPSGEWMIVDRITRTFYYKTANRIFLEAKAYLNEKIDRKNEL